MTCLEVRAGRFGPIPGVACSGDVDSRSRGERTNEPSGWKWRATGSPGFSPTRSTHSFGSDKTVEPRPERWILRVSTVRSRAGAGLSACPSLLFSFPLLPVIVKKGEEGKHLRFGPCQGVKAILAE